MHLFRKIFCLATVFVMAPLVALGAPSITNSYQVVTTVDYVTAKVDERIQKPTSAAQGKVLTYGTNADAESRPEAQYVKVPVATGDPSAASNAPTPTGFASIWLQ